VDTLEIRVDHPLRSFRLDVELTVGREIVAVVGPSGAGKTTLLRAIAGLTRPAAGHIRRAREVWFDARRGIDLPPERRSVGLVFQEYALFPHMTVARNVAYAGGRERGAELLRRLGIERLAAARPPELSGGERQRVALARALAREPTVLLLDEPLAALDVQTRGHVRGELRELLVSLALPTIVVTHDYTDAAALAGRIAVLVEGRIVQAGAPAELIAAPASPFVAEFTGVNLVRGVARTAGGLTQVTLDDGTMVTAAEEANGPVGVLVYPWDVVVAHDVTDDSMQNHVRGRVSSIVPVGNRVRVRIGALTAEVTAASAERLRLREGEPAVASFKATATKLLPLT
jgi:molybdate transport system ATP-binding protein